MSKAKVTPAPPGPQAPAPPFEHPDHAPRRELRPVQGRGRARAPYEHLEDDDDGLSWSRIICLDAIDEALKAARVAYVKAVGDKTAVATETAR